jgi:DNA-binding MarR family transcriptional regulator
MTTVLPPSTAELASALRLALMRTVRRIRGQRVNPAATLSQLSALATIGKLGPLSAGEVAAAERIQPPSMTRILSSLEAAGWIERAPHQQDRRQSVIAISASGSALLDAEARARDEWLAQRLVGFSDADLDTLRAAIAVLDRLAAD